MAEFTLQALKNELDTDPLSAGYSGMSDAEVSDAINDPGHATLSGTVRHREVSESQVRAAVPYDEYDALLADEQEWLRWLTGGGGGLTITDEVYNKLATYNAVDGIWAIGDEDAPDAIKALIEFTGSRAEVLWGEGTRVSPSQVADARRL